MQYIARFSLISLLYFGLMLVRGELQRHFTHSVAIPVN